MYTIPASEKANIPESYIELYYPYEISEWTIEYKPLPFMKEKKETVRVVTNLFRKETSLFEWPLNKMKSFTNIGDSVVLPERYEEGERKGAAREFLRNTYLHRRKTWSYPIMNCVNTYALYIPYAVFSEQSKKQDRYRLLEVSTGYKDQLENHQDIFKYMKQEGVIQ